MPGSKSEDVDRAAALVDTPEKRAYLAALVEHKRVVKRKARRGGKSAGKAGSPESPPLPPGVTHVLQEQEDGPPLLIEKRKSFL